MEERWWRQSGWNSHPTKYLHNYVGRYQQVIFFFVVKVNNLMIEEINFSDLNN